MASTLSAVWEDLADLSVCNGCDGCGLRCTTDVPMTRAEWSRIRGYVDQSPGVRSSRPRSIDVGDEIEVSVCEFRDTTAGRCRIYPVRPLVCRMMGHVPWMPCPIDRVRVIPATATAKAMLEAYCGEPRRTYAEWDALDARRR